jgi:hypothetical protein
MVLGEGFEPSRLAALDPKSSVSANSTTRADVDYVVKNGGESGIRTHGAVTPNGFQNRGLKPLSHLSFCVCNKWCPEGDLNPHAFRQRILNPPCLPIPPSGPYTW